MVLKLSTVSVFAHFSSTNYNLKELYMGFAAKSCERTMRLVLGTSIFNFLSECLKLFSKPRFAI